MGRNAGGIGIRLLGLLLFILLAGSGCATSPLVPDDTDAGTSPASSSTPDRTAVIRAPAPSNRNAVSETPAAALPTPSPERLTAKAPLASGSIGLPPKEPEEDRAADGVWTIGDSHYPGTLIPVANDDGAETRPVESSSGAGGTVEINFDNADLVEVIRTLADILNIQYLLDPGVQGVVTIHTTGGMAREDLFPLFFKILEVNGLTAVKEGTIFRITPASGASRLPIAIGRNTRSGAAVPPGERVMIQIIPLKHISAGEMSKLLVPFASDGATIVAHEATNTLVVVDRGDNILKILQMAAAFDIGLFERVEHRFYLLQNASSQETAAMLQEIFAVQGNKGTVRFMAIERLNAVLALSADPRVFARTDQLMVQLDAPGSGTEPQIHVYFVKNGGAEELSNLLNAVFGNTSGVTSRESTEQVKFRFSRNPFALRPEAPVTAATPPPAETEPPPEAALAATPRGDIVVIPDPVRNALLIECTPNDYQVIARILDRIDVLPRQVLIEAMVAEISLDDRFELGVEWEYTRDRDSSREGLLSATINGDGLSYAVAFSQDLLHNLDTLASNNKVNILSSPHVLASDGKEAKIDIANEVPIISSETVISSAAEPLVTTDVQYRDTGVLLAVTPHINENGLVTLDIYQEVSEQGEDVNVAGANYPSFIKRSVDTTLTVSDDQTIVLGGLIRENKSQGRSGVPGLIDIPGLGWLFGARDSNYDKAELIILLTPRVITSLDHVRAVTEEFERKVAATMQYIRSKEKAASTYYKP